MESRLGSGKSAWSDFIQYSDVMVKYDRDLAVTVMGDQVEFEGHTFFSKTKRSELDRILGTHESREGLDFYPRYSLSVQRAKLEQDEITMFCLGTFPKL